MLLLVSLTQWIRPNLNILSLINVKVHTLLDSGNKILTRKRIPVPQILWLFIYSLYIIDLLIKCTFWCMYALYDRGKGERVCMQGRGKCYSS